MKNSLFAVFASFALLALMGCPPPANRCDLRFEDGEPFLLGQGLTACLNGAEALTIRFDSVSGDSRCPVNVQCIWAGRADAVLTLGRGTNTRSVTLASGDLGQGGTGEVTFERFKVKLESVEPAKEEGKPIAQKDYKVKLLVTAQPGGN